MLKDFDTEPGASGKAIANAEADLNWQLPAAYRQLLEKSNGGKGTVGGNYLVLWSAEELAEFNREYQVQEHAPGLVLFGSDGEGQGYAFDIRQAPYAIVRVPLIGMDLQNASVVAPEFAGFIGSLR